MTADPADRRQLLQGLADALTAVGARLRALETAKRMIFLLAARAEAIADQSLRLASTRAGDLDQAARALVVETRGFAADFTSLSERVAADIRVECNFAESLVARAGHLLRLVGTTDGGSGKLAQLLPLADSLASVAERQAPDRSIPADTSVLAERAAGLAAQAETATTGADMRRAGAALYHGLRTMADDAAAVSRRIDAEAGLLNAATAALAAGAERMSQPAGTPFRSTPTARIQEMVRQGRAAMEWMGR